MQRNDPYSPVESKRGGEVISMHVAGRHMIKYSRKETIKFWQINYARATAQEMGILPDLLSKLEITESEDTGYLSLCLRHD